LLDVVLKKTNHLILMHAFGKNKIETENIMPIQITFKIKNQKHSLLKFVKLNYRWPVFDAHKWQEYNLNRKYDANSN